MKLIDDAATVLKRSASLWCIYIATMAGAVHEAIGSAPHGLIPDALVQRVDGWATTIVFLSMLAAIPARVIHQPGLNKDELG